MMTVTSEQLTRSYPAVPGSVPVARQELVAFANDIGADADQLHAIRLATSEALTNVVMHAYASRSPGSISLTAGLAGSELWILIGDDGGGLRSASESPGLGVGLALIAQASDALTIMNRSNGGTEVRMCFTLDADGAEGSQDRGSSRSASSPASPRFSTTT